MAILHARDDDADRRVARLPAAQPDDVEAMVRAYLEGVAAASQQKEGALQVIQKYTRL